MYVCTYIRIRTYIRILGMYVCMYIYTYTTKGVEQDSNHYIYVYDDVTYDDVTYDDVTYQRRRAGQQPLHLCV